MTPMIPKAFYAFSRGNACANLKLWRNPQRFAHILSFCGSFLRASPVSEVTEP